MRNGKEPVFMQANSSSRFLPFSWLVLSFFQTSPPPLAPADALQQPRQKPRMEEVRAALRSLAGDSCQAGPGRPVPSGPALLISRESNLC